MKAHPKRLKVLTYPNGVKDACDLFDQYGDAGVPMFQNALDKAQPWVAWVIDTIEQDHNIATPEGKDEAVEDLCETLARLTPFERSARVQELAAKLDASEFEIRRALNETYAARHGKSLVEARPLGLTVHEIED